jgi:hypothetical protein
MGRFKKLRRGSAMSALAFHEVHYGPPPTSSAARVEVASTRGVPFRTPNTSRSHMRSRARPAKVSRQNGAKPSSTGVGALRGRASQEALKAQLAYLKIHTLFLGLSQCG